MLKSRKMTFEECFEIILKKMKPLEGHLICSHCGGRVIVDKTKLPDEFYTVCEYCKLTTILDWSNRP